MNDYLRPRSLDEAVAHLARHPSRILAGGTDLYPDAGRQLDGPVLDLTAVDGLTGFRHDAGLRIGAATSWTALAEAQLPPALAALQQAARQIGGRQIQNAGTIGGNLCNASPAADGVPPLLVLDAIVEVASDQGLRRMPLADFILGPRRTALQPGEVLVAVLIPEASLTGASAFEKLGARTHLVISIVMVAARVRVAAGRLAEVAIAVGACSAVATRLPLVEAALCGVTPDEVSDRLGMTDMATSLAPIDDVRATARYRLTAAAELVRRAVLGAMR